MEIALCCKNLKFELVRRGIKENELCSLLHISNSALDINFKDPCKWSYDECVTIRDTYFKNLSLEYLFTGKASEAAN